MESPQSPRRRPAPFVVAHRFGNSPEAARRAFAASVRVVEADVRLFHGRLEVRHLKTLGPVPILWDRWRLASPFRRRLRLADLLAALGEDTELLLDVKGVRARIARLVHRELAAHGGDVVLCARSRRVFDALRGEPDARVVRSVGSRRQLRSILRRREQLDGVSIHARLLDAAVVAKLREISDLILTWPVRSAEQARLLASWGVDGLITERLELQAAVADGAP